MCPHLSYRPSWSTWDCMRHEILNPINDQHRYTDDSPMRNHDRPMNNLVREMYSAHFRRHVVRNLGMWIGRRQWNDLYSVGWRFFQWQPVIHVPVADEKKGWIIEKLVWKLKIVVYLWFVVCYLHFNGFETLIQLCFAAFILLLGQCTHSSHKCINANLLPLFG